MSNVLARLRVTETHGIRRFLYPLTAEVTLPRTLDYAALGIATRDNDIDMERLCLVSEQGVSVPVQVTHFVSERFRVDFAVSLAPGEAQEYRLMPGSPKVVDDPLHLTKRDGDFLLRSRQHRFEVGLLDNALIGEVVYDGASFLRDSLSITCGGRNRDEDYVVAHASSPAFATLTAWVGTSSPPYEDNRTCATDVTITACKSWATVVHKVRNSKPGDEVTFTLPLAITPPTLTCDFGVGGYVFGKLQVGGAEEVVWQTQFAEGGTARWTVATAGRVDYVGEATAAEFLSQRWFHLIDSDKALAVAITGIPEECAEMTVTLRVNGDVIVAFRLGDVEENKRVKFGVCYHFLNDVPAIAAATNPQSILLPPTVEVLQGPLRLAEGFIGVGPPPPLLG